MAKKKQTSVQKVRSSYVRAWKKPTVKLLHLLVFAAVFMWLGHYMFPGHAEGPYPTGSNDIVAELQTVGGLATTRNVQDGTLQNAIAPGDVIATGDGTLYCNTSADGTLTQGKMGPGELKQLFNDVNGDDVHAAARNQHFVNDQNINYDTLQVLIVNSSGNSQVIYNQDDTTGVFARTAAKLQQKCKDNNPSGRVVELPSFNDINPPVNTSPSVASRLTDLFFAKATADQNLSGATDNFNAINSHRTSYADSSTNKQPYTYEYNHKPPLTLTRKGCLDSIAQAWAAKMASQQLLSHNTNLGSQINNKCDGDPNHNLVYSYSENVGNGPGQSIIEQGFLASCKHHADIDDRQVTVSGCTAGKDNQPCYYRSWYVGVAVYIDGKGVRWLVQDYAYWGPTSPCKLT